MKMHKRCINDNYNSNNNNYYHSSNDIICSMLLTTLTPGQSSFMDTVAKRGLSSEVAEPAAPAAHPEAAEMADPEDSAGVRNWRPKYAPAVDAVV